MKSNKTLLFLALFTTTTLFNCSSSNTSKEQSTEKIASTEESSTNEDVVVTGFNSIEELAASVVKSIKARDYDTYYSHVMSEEMELAQAESIADEEVRKKFLHEYGFSLHEEKEYFDNLLHYYDSRNIDLSKATLADMEYIEYKGGEYEPIMMYEVFIPIEMEVESLIDFTIILVDGKYFLTSEIGV